MKEARWWGLLFWGFGLRRWAKVFTEIWEGLVNNTKEIRVSYLGMCLADSLHKD